MAAGQGPRLPPPGPPSQPQAFHKVEDLISTRLGPQGPSPGSRWREVGESWVLYPPGDEPDAVVHFIGGAFVGAAPQLAYRTFLEALANRGVLVRSVHGMALLFPFFCLGAVCGGKGLWGGTEGEPGGGTGVAAASAPPFSPHTRPRLEALWPDPRPPFLAPRSSPRPFTPGLTTRAWRTTSTSSSNAR